MKRLKWLVAAAAWIAIIGCARSSAETPNLTGFNEHGERMTFKAASSGEVCPASSSYFAARCEDSGFTVLTASDCTLVCSGAVEP